MAGRYTSNAGALLLREADRAMGLTAMVAGCFRDGRDPGSSVHSLETMVAQRIHGQALGYEDLNDHDALRHDPILRLISDTLTPKRANVATLAGQIHAQSSGDGAGGRQSALSQDRRRRAGVGAGVCRHVHWDTGRHID